MRKILGIGLSRTGTNSLCAMMQCLGFHSIHLPLSLRQIDAHDFANDTPVTARFEELDQRYPGAKFIYTRRDPAAWLESCRQWLEPDSRRRWLEQLPGAEARRWIFEGDVKLYGRGDLALSSTSREELLAAYARHEHKVRAQFHDRQDDLLVLDVTDPGTLPYSQLVQFLEKNRLLVAPWKNASKPGSGAAAQTGHAAEDPLEATDSLLQAEAQVRLARVWAQRGKSASARQKYERALWLVPHHVTALHELGMLLIEQGHAGQAIGHFRQALARCPNESVLHKGLVDAFVASDGLDAAFHYYGLSSTRQRAITLAPADLILCLAVRNQARRLPFFLSYYRKLGISTFLVVDNDSEDNTLDYLEEQVDVHVWHSAFSFNQANFGSAWFEVLLRKYGLGHWCLIVDIDELLYYPGCEHRRLTDLCDSLDRKGKAAFPAVLLDMYSDQPVAEVQDEVGQDFREVCPFFDRTFYSTRQEHAGPYENQTLYFGGVRSRVFGQETSYLLSKVPLLKYETDTLLAGGQHWSNCAVTQMAAESGCLLHFKFMSGFRDYVASETARKQHYGNAVQYHAYQRALGRQQSLEFYDPGYSARLEDSAQLVHLGIMAIDTGEETALPEPAVSSWPGIQPLPAASQRPFWSVMITVYQRTACLPRALRSALDQADDSKAMQIVVVSDSPDAAIRAEVESIVAQHADPRLSLYQTTARAGHPEIFNICLRQAQGHWLHILHDDDWVLPGYYRAMERGIETEPGIGVAFCRGIHANAASHTRWVSWLERETPGIPDNWLERIALHCRLGFSSVVVRRTAYEELGGFDAAVGSAFDWDMWKRLAMDYPFWFEPEILACSSKDGQAETNRLQQSAQQIAHGRASIEQSHHLYPEFYTDELSQRAYDKLATAALLTARQKIEAGEFAAAFAHICEGLKCSRADKVTRSLLMLLAKSSQ